MECMWAHAHAHAQGTDLALIAGALHDRSVLDADLVCLVVTLAPPPSLPPSARVALRGVCTWSGLAVREEDLCDM
jgi:hypothetical protein